METARRTLATASDLIAGDRNASHGHYPTEARRIGQMWGALLNLPDAIPPRTVATMMIALKLARATAGQPHADDWIDIAGYAGLGSQIDADTAEAWAT